MVLQWQPQTFTYAGRQWKVMLRHARAYHPFSLTLLKVEHDVYAGTDIPKNFSSRVRVNNPDGRDDHEALIYMNNPLRARGLTFAAVHDSYWTHAADVDTLSASLRDQFTQVHVAHGRHGVHQDARRRSFGQQRERAGTGSDGKDPAKRLVHDAASQQWRCANHSTA